jgi:hypothetical protein
LSVNQNYLNAATGLVDFSRDFLIALWFAAHDNKGKNGKVLANLWLSSRYCPGL